MESSMKPRKKIIHHSRLVKKNSVARLKAGETTISELCLELNIDRHVVKYWCNNEERWNDVDGSISLRKHYPDALKRKFVREVEAGELTLKEACITMFNGSRMQKFGLRNSVRLTCRKIQSHQ